MVLLSSNHNRQYCNDFVSLSNKFPDAISVKIRKIELLPTPFFPTITHLHHLNL